MRNVRYIAYYHVRADHLGGPNLGHEAQQQAIHEYLQGGLGKLVQEYTEIETGKRKAGKHDAAKHNNRPQLANALLACREQGALLIIGKMDRLARDAGFLRALEQAEIEFIACDLPALNLQTVGLMASVAEEEHLRVSARIKASLAAAKARGVKLGGDRGNAIAAEAHKGAQASKMVRQANAERQAEDIKPIIDAIKVKGITSLHAIAGVLNARGIKTSRGARWHATSVKRVIERASGE